ncbi:MAG TPA: right-handed parallel beta-helix repeat-containing protein [Thermoanaerobaculia bacterium]
MTRRSLGFLLVSLLLALPTLGQAGDLSAIFTSDARIAVPYYTWNVRLQWNGEQPARDVVLELNVPGTITQVHARGEGMTCTDTNPVRCTMPFVTRDDIWASAGVSVRLEEPGTYEATATVSTSTPEGPASNNSVRYSIVQTGLPDMWGSLISEDETMEPGGEGSFRLGITNSGGHATNIVVRAKIEDGGEILRAVPTNWGFGEPTATCTIAGGEVTCRIPEMDAIHDFELVRLHYRAPDRREGGRVVATASVESDREDFDPDNNAFRAEVALRRLFVVDSTEDEGTGTLRQAILEAGAACDETPCTIGFRGGVQLVQPRTPLPHLRGAVRVSGGREARVVLDGSLLSEGHGLVFDGGCHLDVRNLEIRNFPGHGIEARQDAAFYQCYDAGGYGLYVRNSWLANNERGIVAKAIDVSLRENVIVDHRRAGIFIDGSYYSEVFNNVVVNNGATGIFVNTADEPQFGGIPPGADLVENIVHGNGEWGIVRTRNRGLVQMRRNSMIRNGLRGWDIGLDLIAPNRDNDISGIPNKPNITHATYDPATDTTTIHGTSWWGASVDLYASTSLSRHGHPEAERWLGATHVFSNEKIELTVPGDLRGQWITGTITRGVTLYFLRDEAKPAGEVYRPPAGYETSELSDPVQVF